MEEFKYNGYNFKLKKKLKESPLISWDDERFTYKKQGYYTKIIDGKLFVSTEKSKSFLKKQDKRPVKQVKKKKPKTEKKKSIQLSKYSVNFPYGEVSSVHLDVTTTPSNVKKVEEKIEKWYPSGFHYVSDPKVKGNIVSADLDIGGLEPDEFLSRFKILRKSFKENGINVKNMKAKAEYSDFFIKNHAWKYKKNARRFSG